MTEQPIEEQTEKEPVSRVDSFRTLCFWIFVISLVACAIAFRVSVITTAAVRAILVATLLMGIFTGLLYVLRLMGSRPGAAYPGLFFLGLFILWTVLGNKPPHTDELRDRYKWRLGTYQDAPYRWGGERDEGIDASGLARASLWQAMFFEGMSEFSPRLLGPTLWKFWWRDMGARDMLQGRYGYTRVVGHADKLAGYPTIMLEKGDMAVTDNGIHVMIYYGDGKWIEASPDDRKVVINEAAADSKRAWFRTPVTFARWTILDE